MTVRIIPPAGPQAVKWMARAACRNRDPTLFFPIDEGGATAARAICKRCDVRAQCLAYAMENRITHGVWGGLSELDRGALRRG